MNEPPDPEQGALVAGCFRCELLGVQEPVCARCAGATRFVAAQMMSADDVEARLVQLTQTWKATATETALVTLLEALHLYGPPARRALAVPGAPTLDELRRAYLELDTRR